MSPARRDPYAPIHMPDGTTLYPQRPSPDKSYAEHYNLNIQEFKQLQGGRGDILPDPPSAQRRPRLVQRPSAGPGRKQPQQRDPYAPIQLADGTTLYPLRPTPPKPYASLDVPREQLWPPGPRKSYGPNLDQPQSFLLDPGPTKQRNRPR